jgi:hypothetical protein
VRESVLTRDEVAAIRDQILRIRDDPSSTPTRTLRRTGTGFMFPMVTRRPCSRGVSVSEQRSTLTISSQL